MPFVDRTASKNQTIPTDVKKLFIGRTNELNYFVENILKTERPFHNIVSVWGQGGVGKSTLLARFIDETQATNFKDYCITAIVDDRQTTPVSIMEKMADQLQITGEFEKSLEGHKEALRRLHNEHETMRDATLRKTAGIISSLAKEIPVPVVNTVAGKGTEVLTEYALDKLHYRQLLKDARRLEDPISELTKVFVEELSMLADTQIILSTDRTKRRRRVILFFDNFEQLAAEIAPWLLDYFLAADISLNVVLVIAGRSPIERTIPDDPKRWLPYFIQNTIYQFSLESFTEEETFTYLIERGITDAARIATIWQLSRGLPLYLGLLTSNSQGTVDPTADVVANFLRWIPEQEQSKRKLVLDAALLSRPFNQDEMAAFAYLSEEERPALYRWLKIQPFVRCNLQDGRYTYHELAQELFSRHLYQLSPSQCRVTRSILAEYYQQRLKEVEAEKGKDMYDSAEWLELILAQVWQLFLLPDEASHIEAIEQILSAYEYVKQEGDIIRLLRDFSKEQQNSQISSAVCRITKQLLQCFEADTAQEFLAAVDYLIEKVGNVPSFSIKRLASLYFRRANAYHVQKEYRRALTNYDYAIKLDPKNATYYDYRGYVFHELKDYQLAIADYDRAIELDPTDTSYYSHRDRAYRKIKD